MLGESLNEYYCYDLENGDTHEDVVPGNKYRASSPRDAAIDFVLDNYDRGNWETDEFDIGVMDLSGNRWVVRIGTEYNPDHYAISVKKEVK